MIDFIAILIACAAVAVSLLALNMDSVYRGHFAVFSHKLAAKVRHRVRRVLLPTLIVWLGAVFVAVFF